MVRVTVFTCDRCGRRLEGVARHGKVGSFEFDLCLGCWSIFTNMDWVSPHVQPLVATKVHAEREIDLTYIRERAADALVAWGEGDDENARKAIRDIAARAARQT